MLRNGTITPLILHLKLIAIRQPQRPTVPPNPADRLEQLLLPISDAVIDCKLFQTAESIATAANSLMTQLPFEYLTL